MKNLVKNLQLLLLGIILLSTIIAVVLEIRTMFLNQTVTLADLLLMFLYLEVMAMVRVFWEEQSISISLPLLIAITALSRFIILQGKQMDASQLLYESIAIVFVIVFIFVFSKGIEVLTNTNSYKIPYGGPDKSAIEKWLPFTQKKSGD